MSQSDIKVPATIFREYIGMNDNIHDFPGDMINEDIPEFHFILGFAIDTYNVEGEGTGLFKRAWNFDDFSPTKVANLKKEHKNVKVVISIGGNDAAYPFNPENTGWWTDNAVGSIKELIQEYENSIQPVDEDNNIIDGIDISYEHIYSRETEFVIGIWDLIQRLKDDPDVSKSMKVVSISPTQRSNFYYSLLYYNNPDNIDWISYKFYNQNFPTENEFVNLFNKLVNDYGKAFKLVAGFSTDTSTPTPLSQQVLVDGCTTLLNNASLAGVFVWNANASAPTYSLEGDLQKLLTKK